MRARRTHEGCAIAGSLSQTQDVAHVSRLAVVGALTASIAHEIHQPLGAILANAEAGDLLCERARNGDASALATLREILSHVRRDALRASGVIRDVRALAGQRVPAFAPCDANALAISTVRLLDVDLRRRRLRIHVLPLPGDATLHCDRTQIERVLVNLLLNAMDATASRAATAGDHARRRTHGRGRHRILDPRRRPRPPSGAPGQALPFLPQHQVPRHGPGPGDRALDRGVARRPDPRTKQRRGGGHVPRHPAERMSSWPPRIPEGQLTRRSIAPRIRATCAPQHPEGVPA